MKIETLVNTFKYLYKHKENHIELDREYETLLKYIPKKKDLTQLDFFQSLNDFTNRTELYIIPINQNKETFEYTLKVSVAPIIAIDNTFDHIYIIETKQSVVTKISRVSNEEIVEIEEIPYNEIIKEGIISAYIVSNTRALFEDSKDLGEKKEKRNPLRLFFKLLKPDKKEIIFLYIYAIFGGFMGLSLPLGVQTIVGLVMGAQYSSSLFLMILLVIIGVVVAGLMQIMQVWLVESIQQKIFVRSAFEFAFKAPRIKLEALADKYAPELMNRFFDTVNIQKSLPKILIDFTQANLQILFGLILLSIYHPLFLVFGGFLLGVFYLIFRVTGPTGMKASLKESKYKYDVAFWLEEVARTMRIFKVAGSTNLPLEKTDSLVGNYLDARKKHFRILVTQYSYMVIFKMLVTGILLILGSMLILNEQINIGQFVASEIIIIIVLNAVEKVILSLENIYDILTSVEKISTVTQLPTDREDGIPFNYIDNEKGIEINYNINHYKTSNNVTLISNVNLHILPGEKVCITGANGSGKSSLLSLTTGLYSNYDGQILFNSLPLNNLHLRSLHDFVALNFSRESIFKGTLYENITLGRKDISIPDIMWAAEITGLNKLIQSLPKGLETELSPEDKNVPSGDLVKIVLTRCLAERPRLLLLEEFLDSFDFNYRKKIMDHIIQLGESTTVLAISNDPEFASKCDRVIVMDKGTVLFNGKFTDIRKDQYLKSMFYNMF